MQKQSMKKQTILLTTTNVFVRALGFVMRILLSRLMGAQAIGIMELASSVHMLAITPVTAGIPLAVSRMTAKANDLEAREVFYAGRALVKKIAFIVMPLMLIASPFIAKLLGDERTFPAILMSIPCVIILGLGAVHNGYCYGKSNSTYPALSELIEQVLRFLLALFLLFTFSHLSLQWLAAIPAFATAASEAIGLIIIMALMKFPHSAKKPTKEITDKLFKLALPPTCIRFSNTALRSLNAILIPVQLRASGLVMAEATARFGMLSGMVMPIMFLPSVVTGSLAMISTPKIASLEKDPKKLKKTAATLLGFAAAIGFGCAALLYLCAPFIAGTIYRHPEIQDLLRFMCPSVVFMSINQILSGMIAGIGRQKHALYGTLLGAFITLSISYVLTANPSVRIYGAAFAMLAGQLVGLVWSGVLLYTALKKLTCGKCA